jgi:BAAT / Acyl-CoA thioester hydrolase C terminal
MTGVFSPRLIDPRAIAVSGQSDSGETALAVAFLDRRVRAAVILSGAQIPHTGPLRFAERSSPMLATQGTGDVVNPPNLTDALSAARGGRKYLLTLIGAPHLGPYTTQQPQLGIVERVTIAFRPLPEACRRGSSPALAAGAHVPGISVLHAKPGATSAGRRGPLSGRTPRRNPGRPL